MSLVLDICTPSVLMEGSLIKEKIMSSKDSNYGNVTSQGIDVMKSFFVIVRRRPHKCSGGYSVVVEIPFMREDTALEVIDDLMKY
jgi:hypothetical protein